MTRKLEFVMEGESEPDEARVISSFEELRQMKPRCRLPIDIVSEQDQLSQPSISIEKKKYFSFLQTNKNFVNKITESVCSATSSGYSSTSSSPSMSPNYQNDLCESRPVNESKQRKAKGRHSIDSCNSKQTKILTVLFDYESKGKEILGNRVVFSVKKGQLVKVLRDYDRDFHLVAKCSDNSIGFLPKDHTVDLVEVKNKVLKNSLLIAENGNFLASSRLSLGCNNSKNVKNRTERNYENSNNPLFKLTKL